MRKKISPVVLALVLLLTMVSAVSAAGVLYFYNGFEVNADGWFGVSKVATGTNGVPSASGGYHAEVPSGDGSFTRWGAYSSTFPAGGYSTFVDVYLNTALATGSNDVRFDYSSAISGTDGLHRRDFVFSVGTDPTTAGRFVMSVSNNTPGWPANPDRDPFSVTEAGWYTFKHSFYDDGTGALAVDLSVLNAAGDVLNTWTLSDPSDIIGTTVGGNRYGWFVTNEFAFLAIDETIRSGAADKESCKNGGWQSMYLSDGTPFDNQGQCIQYFNTGK